MTIRSASFTRPFGLLVLWMFVASPATALDIRTWVSGVGDDLNPCTRSAPCRTFDAASSKTAPNGEIDALDPAEYSGITIIQGLTIDGAGLATLDLSVNIRAGSEDTVILRNLSINGKRSRTGPGIRILGGRNVLIENCVVAGFSRGIEFAPLGGMNLLVRASTFSDNSLSGIRVRANGAFFARMSATNVRLEGNGIGLDVQDNSLVFVSDSSASNNIDSGFYVHTTLGGGADLHLENVSSSNNGNAGAVAENPGAVIRLSNTSIDHNVGAGVVPLAGGLILSFGNNKFAGNAAGDGTINGPAVPK